MFEILSLLLFFVCVVLLLTCLKLVKINKTLKSEKMFWRYAAIEIFDKSFEVLEDIREAAKLEINEGNIEAEDMPFIFLGGKELADFLGKPYEPVIESIEKSAYELFQDQVKSIANDCSREGYQWLTNDDSSWLVKRALKHA
ncbi:hypothetical protein [Microbulbifer sp. JTAC008]|uniref:hypothetical protein n=1 Tax=unclassified Microbulbifer TaxID=2619833 RepID=UPI00403927E5